MKAKILLTIFLVLVVGAVHFYLVPTALNDLAVNQVKDTVNSTADVRVSTTVLDYTPYLALFALLFIWWKPVADALKNKFNFN